MVLAYEMQNHKERVSKRSETCPLLVLMQECSTECCNQKGHNINRRIVRKMKSITFILCYLKKKPTEQSGNSWVQFGTDPNRSSIIFLEWPFGSCLVEFIGFVKIHNNSEAVFVFCLSSSLFCCTKAYIMILKFP